MPVISEVEDTAEVGSAVGMVADMDSVDSAEDTVADMYLHSQDTELDMEALAEEAELDMGALVEDTELDMEALAEGTEEDTPDRYLLLL